MKLKYKGMKDANGGESSVAKNNRTTTTLSNGQPAGRTKKLEKSNDQQQQHHRSNNSTPTPTTPTSSTKIKLFTNTENTWKSLLRDILTGFVPLFVLYKISTHPAVSNIGYVDPNLPKKHTPQELLVQFAWKKHQEEFRNELLFLQGMNNDRQCYDVPGPITLGDMPVANGNNKRKRGMQRRGMQGQRKIITKGQNTNNKPQGKNTQRNRGIFHKKMSKKKHHRAPSAPSTSSAAPWSARIASTFSGNPTTSATTGSSDQIKGKDSTKQKKSGKRAMKKKYGSRVR